MDKESLKFELVFQCVKIPRVPITYGTEITFFQEITWKDRSGGGPALSDVVVYAKRQQWPLAAGL